MDADDHEAVTIFLVILQCGVAVLLRGFVEGLPEPVSTIWTEELNKTCNWLGSHTHSSYSLSVASFADSSIWSPVEHDKLQEAAATDMIFIAKPLSAPPHGA